MLLKVDHLVLHTKKIKKKTKMNLDHFDKRITMTMNECHKTDGERATLKRL